MQSTDESDLELTVKQSAALLKLEVTLLNMAETGYAKLQPDESIEIHVHREVTGIVANLREIIVNHDLPFEAYEIHHIDGDKQNNKIENLQLLKNNSEHSLQYWRQFKKERG